MTDSPESAMETAILAAQFSGEPAEPNWMQVGFKRYGGDGESAINRPFLRVKALPHGLDLPQIKRQSELASGHDLYAAIDAPMCIPAGERVHVPTGIAVDIMPGFEGHVRPRSGLSFKNGVVASFGTIDADYRGEIVVCLYNHSTSKFWVEPKMRIAQLVICPVAIGNVEYVVDLDDTARGEGGFGSTGLK
jgi:dUTP pyrophosphatase